MIEISHKQAQHLIREGQDRRLPDEQWAVLYAHLEGCPECRAYRQRLSTYEKDMRRSLRTRWSAARGPGKDTSERVAGFRARRKKMRKFLGKAGLWFLGILAFIGYFTYRQLTAPQPVVTPTLQYAAGPFDTQTPVPLQNTFRGLVAFETRRDGNAEIYLLNASPNGKQLTNLTQNPAQDTQPAWSPDGEWLAFLSNRSGKNEVYIMHISGSRLTQLTSASQIEWSGPLEWSYDGKWLGLFGRKTTGGATFIYLVPLDGSGPPRSVANTKNAAPWLHFSSGQAGLAFLSGNQPGALNIINTESGWTGVVSEEDNQLLNFVTGQQGAFDWSLGGRSLVYVAQNGQAKTASSQIRMSQAVDVLDSTLFTGANAGTIDSVNPPRQFRAVSWVPHSLLVAGLVSGEDEPTPSGAAIEGAASQDCWVLRLSNAYNRSQNPRALPELCVEGGLSQSNWTPEGAWAVVIARQPSETVPAIYAMRLPLMTGREDTNRENTLFTGAIYFERLVDLPSVDRAAEGAAFFSEPRVRPTGRLMSFTPQAAVQPTAAPGPVALPAGAPGWIVYSVRRGTDSWIVRSRPNGMDYQMITGNRGEHSCPRISPDGQRVAYLSDRSNPRRGVNEVYVTAIDGKNSVQLTQNAFPIPDQNDPFAAPLPRYDCPVWSPDGKSLAVVHHTPGQAYLALIPVDGKTPPRYLQIEDVSTLSPPVWVPKDVLASPSSADQILLVYTRHYELSTRMVLIDLAASEDRQPAKSQRLSELSGWDDALGVSLSPDRKQLAMILEYQNLASDLNRLSRTFAQLRVIDLSTMKTMAEVNLPRYVPVTAPVNELAWLPGGKLGLVRTEGLIGPGKTIFERFDPQASPGQEPLETLSRFEDLTYHAALSNGKWALFSTETGLWMLDLEEALTNHASAVMISSETVDEVDWR